MADEPRVLVVEDDQSVREAVTLALQDQGYRTLALRHGKKVGAATRAFRPDLAVLDVHLPEGPGGFDMAQLIRTLSDIPVIFLTAADSVKDRLTGFEAGGDDYLVKPFSMAELLARVHALLRRSGRIRSSTRTVRDVTINEEDRTVIRSGTEVALTRTEFDLLLALARSPGRVLSKTQLLTDVWGFDAYDPNLVEVHMSSLRRKLRAHGERLIHTVRGVGYVLRA